MMFFFFFNATSSTEIYTLTHPFPTRRSSNLFNVPHFAGKFGVERMIERMGFSATILRPAYFMDNDLTIKDVVLGHGTYPMPIGDKGLAMIDGRDIGEIAAIELIQDRKSVV